MIYIFEESDIKAGQVFVGQSGEDWIVIEKDGEFAIMSEHSVVITEFTTKSAVAARLNGATVRPEDLSTVISGRSAMEWAAWAVAAEYKPGICGGIALVRDAGHVHLPAQD